MKGLSLVLPILLISCQQPLYSAPARMSAPDCPKKSLLAEIQSTTKVGGEVVVKTKWAQIPKRWSLHGGDYHKLQVKNIPANRLVFVFQKENAGNFETVITREVSLKNKKSDFSLSDWLDETESLRDLSGRVRIFFYRDQKVLCHKNMTVERSELP